MKQRILIITLGYFLICLLVFLSPGRSLAPEYVQTEKLKKGVHIWRRENCVACHSIYGLGGHLGPDLTNIIRYRGKAYVSLMIEKGKPGMPAISLPLDEMEALLEYLSMLNASGTYPLRDNFSVFGELP